LWDRGLQRIKTVVERQQGVLAKSHDERFLHFATVLGLMS
jgi:hypothetical protein